MDHSQIVKVLESLRPGSQWSLNGDSYDGIFWEEENDLSIPTEEEIITECERLQQEWENNQYQRDREKEYPKFAEQLDILYHKGYEGWKEEINKVKQKYPKPE
jgi:hypothetical protein